jgi:hypothetical protein
MRKLARAALFILGISPVGAGWFALRSALAENEARSSRDLALEELRGARALASRHIVGAGMPVSGPLVLKTFLQEMAQKQGIAVAFLSESERDLGKGRHERQVLARMVQADHARLVPFLGGLEAHGGGARLKELHLRPSKSDSAVYEEVEIVLSHVSEAEPGRKP